MIFIWLDSLVNTSVENHETKRMLEKAIHTLMTFEKVNQCLNYIQTFETEQIILIVSGRLGQEILPIIHDYAQILAIYVYCSDKNRNELWSKKYFKIKSVINDLKELIEKLKYHFHHTNEYKLDEILPINFSQFNDQFQFYQLILNCLTQMKEHIHSKTNLICLCRKEFLNDKKQLNFIDDFEKNYSSDQAIQWLTKDCFLSNLLNKSLENRNLDYLYKFHFFLRDIRLQLQSNQYSSSSHTYRAQILSIKDINFLKTSIGQLISIEKFFLTNPNYEQTYSYLRNSTIENDYHRVLFDIHIQPSYYSQKPFSNISKYHFYSSKDMILFMIGTIFQINDIREENQIFFIQMDISNEKIENFMKNFSTNETTLISLATIFFQQNQYDQAEKYYLEFLNQITNDYQSMIYCYRQLVKIVLEKHEYDFGLNYSKKILDLHEMILRAEDPEIANDYHLIGEIYSKKRMFMEAYDAYNQALHNWNHSLGEEHPKIANCCLDIGKLCESEKKYSEAIDYYQKALSIREKLLLPYHLDLAKIRNKIANVYMLVQDYKQAIKYYQTTLNILIKSKSTKTLEIIQTMRKLSQAYENEGDINHARIQLEKILSLYQQGLPSDHPEIEEISNEINRLSTNKT